MSDRVGSLLQIPPRVGQQVVDLALERPRLARKRGHGGVGRPHQRAAVPGDREQDAAVVGAGNHDGRLAGQEASVEHEMGPLAGGDHRRGAPARRACGSRSAKTPVALTTALAATASDSPVSSSRASTPGDPAVALDQPGDRHVIERDSAQVGRGAGQRDGQPGVIELAVGVEDPAPQARRSEASAARVRVSRPRDPARAAQAQVSGQPVVEPEPGTVVGKLPADDRPAPRSRADGRGGGRSGAGARVRGVPRGPGGCSPGRGSERRRGSAWCCGWTSPRAKSCASRSSVR